MGKFIRFVKIVSRGVFRNIFKVVQRGDTKVYTYKEGGGHKRFHLPLHHQSISEHSQETVEIPFQSNLKNNIIVLICTKPISQIILSFDSNIYPFTLNTFCN